jgi:hypothetical protein
MSNTEIIIRYLDGELNNDEVLEFEELLKSDPDLNEEYPIIKETESFFKDKSIENFNLAMQKAHKNFIETYQSQPRTGKSKLRPEINKKYSIAAVIIILIVNVFVVMQSLSLNASNMKNYLLSITNLTRMIF